MNESVDTVAEQISSLSPREAASRLIALNETFAVEVGSRIRESLLRPILEEVRRELIDASNEDALRMRSLFLLRDVSIDPAIDLMPTLIGLVVDTNEIESVRCLALDAIEKKWLSDALSAAELNQVLKSIDITPGSRLCDDYFRILVDLFPDGALEQFRHWLKTPMRSKLLLALGKSDADASRHVLAELFRHANTADEKSSISEAIHRHNLARLRRAISSEANLHLTPSDIELLIANHEFSLLRRAVLNRRANILEISGIKYVDPETVKSKSQRRHLRYLARQI